METQSLAAQHEQPVTGYIEIPCRHTELSSSARINHDVYSPCLRSRSTLANCNIPARWQHRCPRQQRFAERPPVHAVSPNAKPHRYAHPHALPAYRTTIEPCVNCQRQKKEESVPVSFTDGTYGAVWSNSSHDTNKHFFPEALLLQKKLGICGRGATITSVISLSHQKRLNAYSTKARH